MSCILDELVDDCCRLRIRYLSEQLTTVDDTRRLGLGMHYLVVICSANRHRIAGIRYLHAQAAVASIYQKHRTGLWTSVSGHSLELRQQVFVGLRMAVGESGFF